MVAIERDMAPVGRVETHGIARIMDETKSSLKSTEMYAFILAVVGVLYAANEASNFFADQAWTLVTALTIGYMVSRGLAKSGSRHSGND